MTSIHLVDILDKGRSGRVEWELPLGLMTLSHQLKSEGYKTKIHQIIPRKIDALIEDLRDDSPLFVGISGVFSYFALSQIEFARKLKTVSDCPVIIGGPAATMTPDLYLHHPEIDYLIMGEAEDNICKFAKMIEGVKVDIHDISGLCYRKNGNIIKNELSINRDLSRFNFDFSDLSYDFRKYVRNGVLYSFRTSRGCPFRCTFCYNSGCYNPFRSYSVDVIVDCLSKIKRIVDFNKVRMIDDHLFANKSHAYKMIDALDKIGIGIYNSDTRAEDINVDFLNFLKDKKFHSVYFGYESENPRILKLMGKHLAPEKVISALDASKEVPYISLNTQLIVGIPDQNKDEVIATCLHFIELQEKYPNLTVHIVVFNPIPGTTLYHRAVHLGFSPPYSLQILKKQMITSAWKYLGWRYQWLPWVRSRERAFLNRIYIITFSINAVCRNRHVPKFIKKIILHRYKLRFVNMDLGYIWENVLVRCLWLSLMVSRYLNRRISWLIFKRPQEL